MIGLSLCFSVHSALAQTGKNASKNIAATEQQGEFPQHLKICFLAPAAPNDQ